MQRSGVNERPRTWSCIFLVVVGVLLLRYRLTAENKRGESVLGRKLASDKAPQHSAVHCVGEDFASDAWKVRSCHYRRICLENDEWVYRQSDAEKQLSTSRDDISISTVIQGKGVALGPQSTSSWIPNVRNDGELLEGYTDWVDTAVVLGDWKGRSASHRWLDAYAVFLVLSIFRQRNFLLVGETSDEYSAQLADILGVAKILKPTELSLSSHPVCVDHALAGIGRLADYGNTEDGAWPSYTVGRDAHLFSFREFLAERLSLGQPSLIRITILTSTETFGRVTQSRLSARSKYEVNMLQVSASAVDAMKAISESKFVVVECDEHAMMGLALSKGSHLILCCSDPSFVGYEMLVNAGYMRLHIVPNESHAVAVILSANQRMLNSDL